MTTQQVMNPQMIQPQALPQQQINNQVEQMISQPQMSNQVQQIIPQTVQPMQQLSQNTVQLAQGQPQVINQQPAGINNQQLGTINQNPNGDVMGQTTNQGSKFFGGFTENTQANEENPMASPLSPLII